MGTYVELIQHAELETKFNQRCFSVISSQVDDRFPLLHRAIVILNENWLVEMLLIIVYQGIYHLEIWTTQIQPVSPLMWKHLVFPFFFRKQ